MSLLTVLCDYHGMNKITLTLLLSLTIAGVSSRAAAEPNSKTELKKAVDIAVAAVATEKKQSEVDSAKRDFAGIKFGVGIAVVAALSKAVIEEAVLVPEECAEGCTEQIVRSSKSRTVTTRLLLESHYFFTPGKEEMIGFGPFLAVQPGTEEIIEAAGLGIMVGFRRKLKKESFNIGLGVLVEPEVKALGKGLERDKPLPAGDTLRFQRRALASLLVLASFSF